MTREELIHAYDLAIKLAAAERLLETYRNAGEIIVALPDPQKPNRSHQGQYCRIDDLTVSETGVIAVLQGRVAAMTEQLRRLGVEDTLR